MSASSSIPVSPSLSPIARPTRRPTEEAISRSSRAFSLARAFRGTTYRARAPSRSLVSRCTIARYATSDLPLAVGIVSMTLRPDSACGRASACGGKSFSILQSSRSIDTTLSSSPRSSSLLGGGPADWVTPRLRFGRSKGCRGQATNSSDGRQDALPLRPRIDPLRLHRPRRRLADSSAPWPCLRQFPRSPSLFAEWPRKASAS